MPRGTGWRVSGTVSLGIELWLLGERRLRWNSKTKQSPAPTALRNSCSQLESSSSTPSGDSSIHRNDASPAVRHARISRPPGPGRQTHRGRPRPGRPSRVAPGPGRRPTITSDTGSLHHALARSEIRGHRVPRGATFTSLRARLAELRPGYPSSPRRAVASTALSATRL